VANEMAEPLYDRFAHVNIETDAKSWMQWASTSEKSYERVSYEQDIDDGSRPKIHPVIYDYIKKKGMQALRTPYERENPQPHADPRRWEMASDMLYATQNPKSLIGIIGEDLTRDFVRFCQSPKIIGKGIIR
jgi:hypothetical protein